MRNLVLREKSIFAFHNVNMNRGGLDR